MVYPINWLIECSGDCGVVVFKVAICVLISDSDLNIDMSRATILNLLYIKY